MVVEDLAHRMSPTLQVLDAKAIATYASMRGTFDYIYANDAVSNGQTYLC